MRKRLKVNGGKGGTRTLDPGIMSFDPTGLRARLLARRESQSTTP